MNFKGNVKFQHMTCTYYTFVKGIAFTGTIPTLLLPFPFNLPQHKRQRMSFVRGSKIIVEVSTIIGESHTKSNLQRLLSPIPAFPFPQTTSKHLRGLQPFLDSPSPGKNDLKHYLGEQHPHRPSKNKQQ